MPMVFLMHFGFTPTDLLHMGWQLSASSQALLASFRARLSESEAAKWRRKMNVMV